MTTDLITEIVEVARIDPLSYHGAQLVQLLHESVAAYETLADMDPNTLSSLGFNALEHAQNAINKDIRLCAPYTMLPAFGLADQDTSFQIDDPYQISRDLVIAAAAHRALRDKLRNEMLDDSVRHYVERSL